MRKLISLVLTVFMLAALTLPVLAAKDNKEPKAEAAEEATLDPKVEAMLAWALETAADDSHGYSQAYRTGPNYDCTSFVSTALMEGFGLDKYLSTGGMLTELEEYGFVSYRRGETEPQKGDILIKLGVHAEICMGDGGCIAAHQDYDGWSGDRSGHEIEYRTGEESAHRCSFCKYAQYTHIIRYEGTELIGKLSPEEREETAETAVASMLSGAVPLVSALP